MTTLARESCWAAAGGPDEVAFVGEFGECILTVEDAAQCIMGQKLDVHIFQTEILTEILAVYLDHDVVPNVAIKSTTGVPELMSLDFRGGGRWSSGLGILPDKLPLCAAMLGLDNPWQAADPLAAARAWRKLHEHARQELRELTGIAPRVSLASTAAAAVLPVTWRRAVKVLHKHRRHKTQTDGLVPSEWDSVRQAYYGPRIECYRPGWRGQAVEWDLRSAYGWALTTHLPDYKIYESRKLRGPLPDQPAWYDVTVEVDSGELPAPLPYRVPDREWQLEWPMQGRWRAWYTREDLERSGVRVLEQHQVLCGRWSDLLRRPVLAWLEEREKTPDPYRRAVLRMLCNTLAGKLVQRPRAWMLWSARDGHNLPDGAVFLSPKLQAAAVPCEPVHWPQAVPHAGTYVTARVRTALYAHLQRGDVLYTDTDSLHLPADAPPPSPIGPAAGEWQEKHRGPAHYIGPRHYRIADKQVTPALVIDSVPRRKKIFDVPARDGVFSATGR